MLMSRNLNNLRGLIVNEVERLEKLKGNPTFPNSHYQEHLTEIQRQTRNILEATEVNL